MTCNASLPPSAPDAEECPRCGKTPNLCVCADIAPMNNRIALLVLQHPQEQDRDLGTARLAALHLANATVKIGLSWASLSRILGREADPQRWAVLYLGSASAAALAPGGGSVVVVGKTGAEDPDSAAILRRIEGIIVLDGTWSQAKALWWRNPWMLKCRRVILGPARPSRYGKLRKEPRADGLSTLEAAAMLLANLENRPEIEDVMTATFERLLARYRTVAPPRPAIDWRKRARRRR